MSSEEIFEYYRNHTTFSQEDVSDFYVFTQDTVHTADGLMAISGLTINLLENEWNSDNLMLLLTCCDGITPEGFERVIVGLLLVMMQHDSFIRCDRALLSEIQEVLTYAPELSFTALCNIARTIQIKQMERFNAQLTKELIPLMNDRASNEFYDIIRSRQNEMEHIARMQLDQNFLIFKDFYQIPFFREKASSWLLPWNTDALMNIDEDDRQEVTSTLENWPLCDSDKYALCHVYPAFKQMIKSQLSVDTLQEVGLNFSGHNIVTNGYVQQLYRYFRLSSFAKAKPFDAANKLRDLLVYRLVVVGSRAQQMIQQFF